MILLAFLVGGIPTPLKNMKVGKDDIPYIMEKKNMFQTTNQILLSIGPDLPATEALKGVATSVPPPPWSGSGGSSSRPSKLLGGPNRSQQK
jgi:hypothetical protein